MNLLPEVPTDAKQALLSYDPLEDTFGSLRLPQISNEHQISDEAADAIPEILFLHASPIAVSLESHGQDKQLFLHLPHLDFKKEAQTIKNALEASNKQIAFRGQVATRTNIEATLHRRPNAVHILCHVLVKDKSSSGSDLHCGED